MSFPRFPSTFPFGPPPAGFPFDAEPDEAPSRGRGTPTTTTGDSHIAVNLSQSRTSISVTDAGTRIAVSGPEGRRCISVPGEASSLRVLGTPGGSMIQVGSQPPVVLGSRTAAQAGPHSCVISGNVIQGSSIQISSGGRGSGGTTTGFSGCLLQGNVLRGATLHLSDNGRASSQPDTLRARKTTDTERNEDERRTAGATRGGAHQETTHAVRSSSPPDSGSAVSGAGPEDSRPALRALVAANSTGPLGIVSSGEGEFLVSRFLPVLQVLAESVHRDLIPKKVIGVGSGEGFLERCFETMGCSVRCYDRVPCDRFAAVERAEFPADIDRCLPEDCSDCVLVAGYPEGYLGAVLAEFIRRGGTRLCTTVEESLLVDNARSEQETAQIREGVASLRARGTGGFFQVRLRERSMLGLEPYIQFYNWPTEVKRLMQDAPALEDCCCEIDLDC